ncbi:S-layer homology domain-containing protein [Cohnella massiliensis]|uniref:S-layer homology domain-containing protein n=1 Tax=Cohnella massiliensis TaxID=1816691 RepID=UPI0015949374|nr:S-layer homology domain-containing protein [Cohnella massiliensis]
MNNQNGARRIGAFSGRRLLLLLSSLLLILSLFPSAGLRAYAEPSAMDGDGSFENPWQVKDAYDLASIGTTGYPLSDSYILMNDVELTGEWGPIGLNDGVGFSGIFDGNGKTISNLYIDRPTEDNIGFFSKISNGHVFDLTIETAAPGVVGRVNVGILAGTIEQTNMFERSWITLITVSGDVTGDTYVGGLAGLTDADEDSRVEFAHNRMVSGKVTGKNNVGGLVGKFVNGSIYNSYSEAEIVSTQVTGGLLGFATQSDISRSYSTGTVQATGSSIGGLVGVSLENDIETSYATGDVAGDNQIAGLIGYSSLDSIEHSYAAGHVDATGTIHGGLIANNSDSSSEVTASYWDTTVSGKEDEDESDASLYGIGRSSSAMMDEATFTSASEESDKWDFEEVWFMETDRYPQLYGISGINFDVEPDYVSGQQTHAHEITIEPDTNMLFPGQSIDVYQVTENGDEKVGTITENSNATVPFALDTTGLDDGTLKLAGFYLIDQNGNKSRIAYSEIEIDSTSPVWEDGASITQNESGGNVELSWDSATDGTGSGVEYYNVYVNSEVSQIWGTTHTIPAPSTPAYYAVEAVDQAGNKSTRLSIGGTASAIMISGSRNVVIGQAIMPFYIASVTGAPSYMQGLGTYVFGGTLAFYVDGVLQIENVPITSTIAGIAPAGMFNFNYSQLPEGVHTLKAVYSGYIGEFHGTPYYVNPSEASLEVAVSALNVTSSDPSGTENDGKTKLAVTPDVSAGNKWVYRNFGSGDVIVPNKGDVLDPTGYADLPADGLIPAANFDKIGVVEIDAATGTVVHIGQTTAVAADEPPAPVPATGLTVTSNDPSGAENDGKTKLTVTPDISAGNKLVYRNFGSGSVTVPNVDDVLTDYADLPADGLIPAANGDRIGVAEIDAETGKVVRFGQASAVASDEPPAPVPATGLTVTSSDPSGAENDGKTKLAVTPDVSAGHKLAYRNFGSGSVTVPNVGDVLNDYADLPADGLIPAANGDAIGVAEIDAETGKVVRFGQASAVAANEPTEPGTGPDPEPVPATGLTVTSSDPTGAENDGKTKLTVAPDISAGNKLVYRNFGSGSVSVPNVDDVLTGYADLPADGLIPAANGDAIGVAEIDVGTGKVVRFGQASAVAANEPTEPGPGPDPEPVPATGLTVTSSDPSGAENDGKTKLTVAPDVTSVNKLVYRNFGSGSVTVPNVGDVLNDYADLPADGLIPAANGDAIGVAEIDATGGKVARFGQTTAVAAAEPAVITPVPVPPASAPGATDDTDDAEVLVNGKAEKLGKATTTEVGGVKTTIVTVDPARLQAKLEAEGSRTVVTIPVATGSDTIIGELNGQIVKNMENASATLVLQTEKGTYTLPALQINIDAISERAGESVALEEIRVQIEISAPNAEKVTWVENAAANGTFTLVAPPVEFTVRAIFGDQTVEVARFNAYVERTIAIPEGVDPNRMTTGVVVDPDGTVRHVPTKIVVIDGKYYAKINSLTNSMYSVVWHPLEFADMANHWAKDAANDMGSRMVIEGTGNGLFSSDREITRAEFAAMVVRGLGLKVEGGAASFTDVEASDWYGGAVGTAAEYGLISGLDDGTFRPNERITREQAMTMIANAMKVTGLKDKLPEASADAALGSFADAAAVSGWAKRGIADSVQAGIVSGRGEAGLAPKAYVTRAEAATMIRLLLQKSDLI